MRLCASLSVPLVQLRHELFVRAARQRNFLVRHRNGADQLLFKQLNARLVVAECNVLS
jgi:hypothetical protein